MYKLAVSELADQDLDNIISYISRQLANPKAAGDLADAVAECYSLLRDNPMIYEQCRDDRLKKEGYRKALIKNYVLVYKINESAKTVNVMRFFYSAQDYMNLI